MHLGIGIGMGFGAGGGVNSGTASVTLANATLVATGTNTSAAWDPSQFGANLRLWLRGDVGNTTTWTDQSGNGFHGTGIASPSTTTVAGQAAFSLAAGAEFANTTMSSQLVTAGTAYTVLAVAQAVDDTGGCVFAVRTSAPIASNSFMLTLGGSTFVWNDGTVHDVVADAHTEAKTAFLAEWQYGGNGVQPGFRMNRSDRSTTGANQTTENGSIGYRVGWDAGLTFPFNGKVAEIVIVNRALTGGERTSWEAYVGTRYGI